MPNRIYETAVLLTCFNRKAKTTECLRRMVSCAKEYNNSHEDMIRLTVFMTDDGCTDGTAGAVRDVIGSDVETNIIQGDGKRYWAGGMRMAWSEAISSGKRWDFYLLLNDDTIVMDNVFDELLDAHRHAMRHYSRGGIYSGITCDTDDHSIITYGGDIFNSAAQATSRRVSPTGEPQMVDMFNANILLVTAEVVDEIGIFPDCYTHSCADNDYCMMAKRNNIPTLVTANVCGICKDDHKTNEEECQALMRMTMKERIEYTRNPLHSDKDYLNFVRRNMPRKYIVSWIMRKIRLYSPRMYNAINKARGLYTYGRE